MKIALLCRSALLAAAGTLALGASLAAPAHASGDPDSVSAKYPSRYAPYTPYAPQQVPGAATDQPGAAPYGNPPPGAQPYPSNGPTVNLGQGSGIGPAVGR